MYRKVLFPLICCLCTVSAFAQPSAPKLFSKQGKYGFKDHHGQIIIPAIYEAAFAFHENLTPVRQKGKWHYIDTLGRPAHQYDGKILTFAKARPYYHQLAVVQQHDQQAGNRYTYIDRSGYEAFVDFSANELGDLQAGYALIRVGKKYGIINACQDLLLDILYDKIDSFSKGYAKVRIDGRTSIIDPYGHSFPAGSRNDQVSFNEKEAPHTLFFANIDGKMSPASITKLDQMATQMNEHPERRYVIQGYGNGGYAALQNSWHCVNTVYVYLIERKGIAPERLLLRYGLDGPYRRVDLQEAVIGDEWQPRTPPPFPRLNCYE